MGKSKVYYHEVWVDGIKLNMRIYQEWRDSVRISVGKKYINLRVPALTTRVGLDKHIDRATKWLSDQNRKSPNLLERFREKVYHDQQSLQVGDKTYYNSIVREQRKTSSAKLKNNTIYLKLNDTLNPEAEQEIIRKLIRRIVAQDNTSAIARRINELNHLYFQKDIKSVKLKYNTSNWGSCSNSGNINISTRLLFAPQDVQDYVLIHELAHLEEMNHSHRFWKIVSDIMPDYQEKEKWLKENGSLCSI